MPGRARPASLAVALILFAVLALGAASARAASAPSTQGVPAPVSLSTGWQFRFDHDDVGLQAGWGVATPTTGWTSIAMPHLFDRKPVASEFGGTVGWYHLRFIAPARTPGFTWAVRFDQIRRIGTVWLNGRLLGTHTDPYVPFALPATGLEPGAINDLVVRVDNRKGVEPREGWWNWGGIPRPVTLEPRGALGLRTPGLMSQVRCAEGGARCRAALRFDGTLENRGTTTTPAPRVTLRLVPPGGGAPIVVARTVGALAPGATTRLRFSVPMPHAKLWSPSQPQLYEAAIITSAGGTATQVDRKAIGLRGIRVRHGALELNGRVLDVRGAAIQEDAAGVGPALSDADIARIVSDLKAVHANVTRAHYLLNEKLLDALDRAGILVWSQAPIYHRDVELETAAGRASALDTLRGTVLAARSHPSVLTHSVANELSPTPDTTPGTREYLDDARKLVADLDPTIPAAVDLLSYPGYPAAGAYRQFPLLGINSYFGWYKGKAAHSTAKLSDLGPYLDRMRRMYPASAMMLTEFGAESTFSGASNVKNTYEFQSNYVRDVLDIVDARPFMSGAIYWTLREFAVKPDWNGGAAIPGVPRDAIHHKGLETYAGVRKPAFAVAAAAFAATPEFRVGPGAAAAPRTDRRRSLLLVLAVGAGLLVLFAAWALAALVRRRGGRAVAVVPPDWSDLDGGLTAVEPERDRERTTA